MTDSKHAPSSVDDCVDGIQCVMRSGTCDPVNLGQDRSISISALVDLIAEIAGVPVVKKFVDGPQGVRGRNCDSTRARDLCGWRPRVSLEDGLARTYRWIEEQVLVALRAGAPLAHDHRAAPIATDPLIAPMLREPLS